MRYDAGFRWGMGNPTFNILVSLAGAGAVACLVFLVLESLLAHAHPAVTGVALFRFQLSSSVAMAIFAGLAIVIYVRLSRSKPSLKK
jgi:hypothetical protein